MHLSVVSPVYLAQGIVSELVSELKKNLSEITDSYEIILVEDHSPDNSWAEIVSICQEDEKVKGIKLSRNFGQHKAITAGLDASKGDWVIVMDCDLQDKPSEISKLYKEAQKGFDIVLAKRVFRKDGFLKRASSFLFYRTLEYLTGIKQDRQVANFGIYSRDVINVLVNEMRESIRYFPMMIRWLGFNLTSIEVDHGKGERPTSYSFGKLLDLALNVMLTFSDKPLRLSIRFGLIIILTSSLYGIYTIFRYFNDDISVDGWASLIVSIWFFSGLIIFILGMVGLYLGKTFEEVKKRPIYIVQKRINL